MDFWWNWLGKNKNREKDTSDEERNHRHRSNNWSDITARSAEQGDAVIAGNSIPRSVSLKLSESPPAFDPNGVNTGEQVYTLLAQAWKIPLMGKMNSSPPYKTSVRSSCSGQENSSDGENE